jgi:hypothetical protein
MHQVTEQVVAAPSTKRTLGSCAEWVNRRASEQAARGAQARLTNGRRKRVDPTTCDRDYSPAELEFMFAMNKYKHKSGRMFPTWSEVLEVVRELGYEKIPAAIAAD